MTKKTSCKELQQTITDLEKKVTFLNEKNRVLSEQEEKYRTLFEKSKDAILIIRNRVFTDCNQATVDLLGYSSKQQFLNLKPSELSPPFQPDEKDSLEKAHEMMDLAVEMGSHRFEWVHAKADGSTFPVEVLLTTISSETESEILHTIWRDISDHKQAQETISESKRRFQALMQQSPAIIELYDINGLQIEVNKAYEEMWNISAEVSVGKFNVLQSEEVQRTGLIHYVNRAYAGETVTVPEYKFDSTGDTGTGAHGRARWLNTKIYPLKNKIGLVENIVIIHEDVTSRKEAIQELKFSEERFRSLVETTSDFIWEVNKDGCYTYVSPKVLDILGYESHELFGKTPFDLMEESEKKKIGRVFSEISKNREPFQNLENINLHKNGSQVVLETSGVPFFDVRGELAGYRGIDRDVTQRKGYEEQLQLTESVFTNSIEGIAITDPAGTIQKVNQAFTEITGYSSQEATSANPRILKSDRHDDEFYKILWKELIEKGQWSGEIWNRRKDGRAYPEWLSISAIRNDSGEVTNYISVFHDISEKKMNEEKLEFLAFHDPLTKLPNRRLFYDRLKISLASAKRYGHIVALLYMDLDNFKDINDSYGHPFGDEFLCKVKDRISGICRESDTLARYGGDEFVIVLNYINNNQEAIDFSNKLIELFAEPFVIVDKEIFTSLSIGLAIFPDNGEDIITLVKNADNALYRAKQDGKSQAALFQQGWQDKVMRKSFLGNALRQAVKDYTSFFIVYQPKIDIRNNTIHGVEALLRWKFDGVLVSPAEFIPIAEETNIIVPLGKWVMRQAMADMKVVHDLGYDEISLSINLSTKQFKDAKLFQIIKETIDQTKFETSKLYFEITESAPMEDIDKSIHIMEEFRSIGVQLSMDDFGTGYSSLSYLKRFPLKELKIDRSFIKDIPNDQNDMAISKTIINMAKSLSFEVVAEGVETTEQLEFLKENGCQLIQGFLFYKPVPIDELLRVIEKH